MTATQLSEMDDDYNEVRTTLISRNITVMGKRTSVRLEPEMWRALREISERERCTIHDICTLIRMRKNPKTSLTAAIRVFLMLYFRAASTEEGHSMAGHGSFEHMKRRARIPSHLLNFFSKKKKYPPATAMQQSRAIQEAASGATQMS